MFRSIFVFLFISTSFNANAQSFVWAKTLGGNNIDYSASVAVDLSGNVYTIGTFTGTSDFDPGPGTANLSGGSKSDIYISKLDASGNYVWAKRIGGNSWDDGTGISIDVLGNIYLTGLFSGTVDFDPGPGTTNLTATGDYDIFVCKLDASGNFLWAKKIGNNNGDYSWDIALDAMNNVYITGQFFGTVDFNPGAGTSNMTSAGGYDFFICKLDELGNFLWAKSLGGLNPDVSYSVDVDVLGNVYATGGFNGTADFDPSASVFTLSSTGSEDVFILKLDANGNFVWAKSFGGLGFDSANSITVDDFGFIYTIGTFEGTADFDPNGGTNNLISGGFYDVFISKLDNTGNFVWAKNLNGGGYEDAFAIDTDMNGYVVFSGCFSSIVDFNPGVGVYNLTPTGSQDIFISMLDQSGNFVWAKALQGINNFGCGMSIKIDPSNNIYTTGFFSSTVDFNPDAAILNLSTSGDLDVFIHKMIFVSTPLPIELISFYGEDYQNENVLLWTTASETNNDYFTVLKSKTGNNFESIGILKGAGNSSETLNYKFIDNKPLNGINYYQLKQTDFNGQTSFSKIIALKNTTKDNISFKVLPNPTNGLTQLLLEDTQNAFQIKITNPLGECIYNRTNESEIDFSSFINGIYFVELIQNNKSFVTKIVKN